MCILSVSSRYAYIPIVCSFAFVLEYPDSLWHQFFQNFVGRHWFVWNNVWNYYILCPLDHLLLRKASGTKTIIKNACRGTDYDYWWLSGRISFLPNASVPLHTRIRSASVLLFYCLPSATVWNIEVNVWNIPQTNGGAKGRWVWVWNIAWNIFGHLPLRVSMCRYGNRHSGAVPIGIYQ